MGLCQNWLMQGQAQGAPKFSFMARHRWMVRYFVYCGILASFGLVSFYLIDDFKSFELEHHFLLHQRDKLYKRYLTVQTLRRNYDTFQKRYESIRKRLETLKGSKMALGLEEFSRLGDVLEEPIEDREMQAGHHYLFKKLFKSEIEHLIADIRLFREALANDYDLQMQWQRYQAMVSLEKHWQGSR